MALRPSPTDEVTRMQLIRHGVIFEEERVAHEFLSTNIYAHLATLGLLDDIYAALVITTTPGSLHHEPQT